MIESPYKVGQQYTSREKLPLEVGTVTAINGDGSAKIEWIHPATFTMPYGCSNMERWSIDDYTLLQEVK